MPGERGKVHAGQVANKMLGEHRDENPFGCQLTCSACLWAETYADTGQTSKLGTIRGLNPKPSCC